MTLHIQAFEARIAKMNSEESLEGYAENDAQTLAVLQEVGDMVRAVAPAPKDAKFAEWTWTAGRTTRHPAHRFATAISAITETTARGDARNDAQVPIVHFSGYEHDVKAAIFLMGLIFARIETQWDVEVKNGAQANKSRLERTKNRLHRIGIIADELAEEVNKISARIATLNATDTAWSRRVVAKRINLATL